jgi:hypothetical protein
MLVWHVAGERFVIPLDSTSVACLEELAEHNAYNILVLLRQTNAPDYVKNLAAYLLWLFQSGKLEINPVIARPGKLYLAATTIGPIIATPEPSKTPQELVAIHSIELEDETLAPIIESIIIRSCRLSNEDIICPKHVAIQLQQHGAIVKTTKQQPA